MLLHRRIQFITGWLQLQRFDFSQKSFCISIVVRYEQLFITNVELEELFALERLAVERLAVRIEWSA